MKKLSLIIVILVAILVSCCSPNFHYKRILKKDKDFFVVDTTISIKVRQKEIKPVTVAFKPVPLDTIYYTDIRDSVQIRIITFTDSIQVTADCPDSKEITIEKKVPEPYPVYVKPSLWDKIKYGLIIAGSILFLFLVVFIVIRLVK